MILASNSPRRQRLLKDAGFQFDIKVHPVDEVHPEDLPVRKVGEFLARKKNIENAVHVGTDEVLLTSDTTVVLGEELMGKPEQHEEARYMLNKLSDTSHEVISGVCVSQNEKVVSFSVKTIVTFKSLSETEINHYIDHYQPFDKAGAYGIQEWIGLVGVKHIQGSFNNVVGLPVQEVYQCLTKEFNVWPLIGN